MSRKYPKKVRKEFARKMKAAEAFVDAWTNSGLASSLITDYSCTLGCDEADTYSDLFRSFGYTWTADQILADHGEDCDTPHFHESKGVWTFTVEAEFMDGEKDEWQIVADGSGADAECTATRFVRTKLQERGMRVVWVTAVEVEAGAPSSTALYDWTDLRKTA